jgi:hypothetical protein
MACDELLIHTDDAGRGLGLVLTPDAALCARVLAHLFPEAPGDVRGALGRAAMGEWTDRAAWVAAPHGVALDVCAAPAMMAFATSVMRTPLVLSRVRCVWLNLWVGCPP